jgi:hypothetical protein
MHSDVRFDLEDPSADTLSPQQRACDDWTTTFNHVRPHEGIGQQMPGELYRVSDRRPGGIVVGGHPDGCRLVDVGQNGSINCDGWKVYLSHALGGYAVGLQGFERGYRVWFSTCCSDPSCRAPTRPCSQPWPTKPEAVSHACAVG